MLKKLNYGIALPHKNVRIYLGYQKFMLQIMGYTLNLLDS